jgi:uncharacterized membrane protein
MTEQKTENIEGVEMRISVFLRWGVVLSGFLMLFGLTVTHCLSWFPSLAEVFKPSLHLPEKPYSFLLTNTFESFGQYRVLSVQQMLQQFVNEGGWGNIFIFAGLCVLLALPALRVAFTAIMLFRQKESGLGICAVVVLLGLALSAFLGLEL